MKYIKLRLDWDSKVIGVKNGVQQVELTKSGISDKEYYLRVIKFLQNTNFSKPNFDIRLEGVTPIEGMIFTDVISYGPYFFNAPFIISEKVKNIFEQFKLPEHFYFPVIFNTSITVNQKYYLFYLKMFGYEVVDDKKCLFYTGSEILGKDFIQFDNLKENLSNFTGTEILVFNKNFPLKIDLFKQNLSSGILVSLLLWQALENAKITGFLFSEPQNPIIRFANSERDNISSWE